MNGSLDSLSSNDAVCVRVERKFIRFLIHGQSERVDAWAYTFRRNGTLSMDETPPKRICLHTHTYVCIYKQGLCSRKADVCQLQPVPPSNLEHMSAPAFKRGLRVGPHVNLLRTRMNRTNGPDKLSLHRDHPFRSSPSRRGLEMRIGLGE